MWKYKSRSYHGDEFEILCLPHRRYLCPVCATCLSGEPPWHRGGFDQHGNYNPDDDVSERTVASYSICPCCDTEFGLSDNVIDHNGMTQMEVWKKLRREWLAGSGISRDDIERARSVFGD